MVTWLRFRWPGPHDLYFGNMIQSRRPNFSLSWLTYVMGLIPMIDFLDSRDWRKRTTFFLYYVYCINLYIIYIYMYIYILFIYLFVYLFIIIYLSSLVGFQCHVSSFFPSQSIFLGPSKVTSTGPNLCDARAIGRSIPRRCWRPTAIRPAIVGRGGWARAWGQDEDRWGYPKLEI